jgi:hypothetical protein
MSQRERVTWISLAVTLVLGYWYFSRLIQLPADADLHSGEMFRLVTRIIVLSIMLTIIGEIVVRIAQRHIHGTVTDDRTAFDERDVLIELKASRNAGAVLVCGVISVLVQIGLLEWAQRRGHATPAESMLERLFTGPLTGLHVAQYLLLALMLYSVTLYVSRIGYYRRGH